MENSDGAAVPLAQLAFGLAASNAATGFAAGAKGAWTSDGLSVPVTVTGGKMLVILGALITMGTPTGVDIASGLYSFDVAGPTPSAADTDRAVLSQFGQVALRGSAAFVVSGLLPGDYRVTGSAMRTTSGSNAPPTVSVSNRSITVLPY